MCPSELIPLCDVILVKENYGDLGATPLYFSTSTGDVMCAEMLPAAVARTDLDPLRCVLVAVRAERCVVYVMWVYSLQIN